MAIGKSVCRGCGMPILWIRTSGMKSMPCDPEPVTYWQTPGGSQKIVTPYGEVLSAELDGPRDKITGVGYISHFATCSKADMFRKR